MGWQGLNSSPGWHHTGKYISPFPISLVLNYFPHSLPVLNYFNFFVCLFLGHIWWCSEITPDPALRSDLLAGLGCQGSNMGLSLHGRQAPSPTCYTIFPASPALNTKNLYNHISASNIFCCSRGKRGTQTEQFFHCQRNSNRRNRWKVGAKNNMVQCSVVLNEKMNSWNID